MISLSKAAWKAAARPTSGVGGLDPKDVTNAADEALVGVGLHLSVPAW
jgi:hypothetical protein